MKIILPGQYPRSEKLIAATRDIERKRISFSEMEKIRSDDYAQLKELQAGFPFYSTGLFNWQDLIRPFSECVDASQEGVLTRFFETNTFWKLLDVKGEGHLDENKFEELLERYFFGEGLYKREAPLLFTLPFIFLFQTFSRGLTLEKIAVILEKAALKLLVDPNKALCFYEPNFGWKSFSEEEKKIARTLIERIKKRTQGSLYIYSTFYSIQAERKFFYSLPVDGFGIDFYANSIADCMTDFPKDKTLLAGIIHTTSTRIEAEETVADFMKMLFDFIPKEQVMISASGPSELLPRSVMDKKITNMKRIIECLPHS